MFKFIHKLIFLIVLILVLLVIFRNAVLKAAVEIIVTKTTGFRTTIGSFSYDFPSTLHIEDLRIRNPKGFEAQTFVFIPEIYASLALSELLTSKRTHFTEIRLNLSEVHIEKNKQGVSNVELLSVKTTDAQAKRESRTPAESARPSTPSKAPDRIEKGKPKPASFLVDQLIVTIRRVTYQDRSPLLAGKGIPRNLDLDLHIQQQKFSNIDSPYLLINLVVVKIIRGATLDRLLNINPEALVGEQTAALLDSGEHLLGSTIDMANSSISGVGKTAGAILQQTGISEKASELFQSGSAKTQDAVHSLFKKLSSSTSSEKDTEGQ